ncbi:MAG: murein L,D-transpeptidase catalytic domain family protein, partial [Beijerinckiaceae bacterium]|nr:murein L,D-transpeptidase catalytic domain family protein [Beijerinckiaceae bacterium]
SPSPYIPSMTDQFHRLSRRTLMMTGAAVAAGALTRSTTVPMRAGVRGPSPVTALPLANDPVSIKDAALDPQLLRKALAALDTHAKAIRHRDRIAIVDFSAPSSEARLHFLDVENGRASRLLVAHGSGSDPRHTGYLERFSNAEGSNASSEGAFLTGDYYVGKHGRSQRLAGLDPTNNHAMERAIVIHGAWYANADMIEAHGKLGRSQGCFAVGETCLQQMFDHLGSGRLLYAARA